MTIVQSQKNCRDLIQLLRLSNCGCLTYLELYQSPQHSSKARSLLLYMQPQQISNINQEFYSQTLVTNIQNKVFSECRDFVSQFYYLKKSYRKKKNKRDLALFGLVFFGLVDVLCLWVGWKLINNFLGWDIASQSFQTTQMSQCQNDAHSILKNQTLNCVSQSLMNTTKILQTGFISGSKGILSHFLSVFSSIFSFISPAIPYLVTLGKGVLGFYAGMGLFYSTGLIICCLWQFDNKKKHSKQLYQEMIELIERNQSHNED